MLEGQVAVLSSNAIDSERALKLLKALRDSSLYCKKRKSYILYEDKCLPLFLDYNRVTPQSATAISLLSKMIVNNDKSIIEKSIDGCFRFNSQIRNRFELSDILDKLKKLKSIMNCLNKMKQLYSLYTNRHLIIKLLLEEVVLCLLTRVWEVFIGIWFPSSCSQYKNLP